MRRPRGSWIAGARADSSRYFRGLAIRNRARRADLLPFPAARER
jgi:hypothetical protein